MLDQGNRTFIGSVVFVDIVGYSKKSVSEQIAIKDRFTALLSESLADIPPEQRLILDTGDGAALSFLGDPEDALFVSMNMRDMVDRAAAVAVAAEPVAGDAADVDTSLPLRIGINLGPVKLVRDINGHPNIVGDGINVAQRIMSFARPGQIVVSRSFFDVVSVISDEYAKLFKYEGSRTDKHVREHEIYIVGDSDAAFKKAKAGTVDRAAATSPQSRRSGIITGTFGMRSLGADGEPLPFLQDRRKLTIAGGALAAVVLVLLLTLILKKPAETPVDPAKSVVAAAPVVPTANPAPTPAVDPAVPAAGTAQDPAKPAPDPAAAPVAPPAAAPAAGDPPKPVPDGKAAAPDPKAAGKAIADPKADPKTTLVLGTIKLNIDPWGDVYINGKSIGVSPPIKQHKLAPGKYTIEVKNSTFKPFVTSVEVKAKEDVSIRHRFQ